MYRLNSSALKYLKNSAMRLVPHDGLDGFQFGDVRDFDDVALCERTVGIPQVVKRMVRHVVVAYLQVARHVEVDVRQLVYPHRLADHLPVLGGITFHLFQELRQVSLLLVAQQREEIPLGLGHRAADPELVIARSVRNDKHR